VSREIIFQPPRRLGLVIQGIAALLLAFAGGVGLWQAFNVAIGPVFLVYLFLSILALSLVPVLFYRAYALGGAFYALERDGIRLHWGLRSEDIPMDAVLQVQRASGASEAFPLPWLRWPGSILGVRYLSDSRRIEFMASSSSLMVLITTADHTFVISPEDADSFLHSFQRFTELGSLSPLPARSIYASFLLARVWNTRIARYLLLAGLALSLILLAWVSLVVPTRAQIILGPFSHGESTAAVHLLLLPVLNSFIYLVDLILGLFFFRMEDSRSSLQARSGKNLSQIDTTPLAELDPRTQVADSGTPTGKPSQPGLRLAPSSINGQILAYLLWGSGVLSPLLFLVAVLFILQG
jgi:hypothetical protein